MFDCSEKLATLNDPSVDHVFGGANSMVLGRVLTLTRPDTGHVPNQSLGFSNIW